MLYPKNKKAFDRELFKNPTAEYRCTPFWAWNCDLKKDELLREIEYMKEMGMGGFHIHPRVGMSTKYLSDDFMDLVVACNEKAKSENMLTWLYDEDKWPSGFAGGYVTKNHENRLKYLLFTKKPYSEGELAKLSSTSSGRIDNRSGNGTMLARYDVSLDSDGYLAGYRRLKDGEDGENVYYAYLETSTEKEWYNFQTYVDTLKKSAIDDFISITHERYKEVVGEDFGKSIHAIFTDEPQVTRKTCLDFSEQAKDVFLPYTTDFDETYTATYGESVLDTFPEIIFELKDKISRARYRYHDHVTERFVNAFADNIGKWCDDNGILLTGHMMEEPTLESQTCAIGEAMRSYRSFGLPGVDMLCDNREFTTVKQTASAAHQYSAPGVLSELYGVTDWDFDFRGHKLQGDWQAALGVSVRVPHLYWVSMRGEAKRDYPASIGHQSAWYKEYSYIEDHFARVNTLMTRGKADIKIGVIHPIESYWLHYGPKDKTSGVRSELDKRFSELTNWLLLNNLDFDFISESLLKDQFKPTDSGFCVQDMTYDVIVVPALETIRSTTLDALEEFSSRGGDIIFMQSAPTHVDAAPSERPLALYERSRKIPWAEQSLLSALEPYRTVKITRTNGTAPKNIIYGARCDGDKKHLFFAHAFNTFRDKYPDNECYLITLTGEYRVTLMDTENGTSRELYTEYKNNNTIINWECGAHSSLLITLEAGRCTAEKQSRETLGKEAYLSGECDVTLDEPNVCVLDMMRWSIDGGEWHEKEEALRVCWAAKRMLGLSSALSHGAQPWAFKDPEPTHTISLEIVFNSTEEISSAEFATEDLDVSDIIFNGKPVEKLCTGHYVDTSIKKVKIEGIKRGENTIVITKPFGAVSTVESSFLLGDFGVRVIGSFVELTAPVRKLRFGDISAQGLPFYGGKLTYGMDIDGGADTSIALGIFHAPAVVVKLDGEKIANVSLAPHVARLGKLTEGTHRLEIDVYASRYNTFGAMHNCHDDFGWRGPNAWATSGGNFCYEYNLKKVGLLTAPRIFKK